MSTDNSNACKVDKVIEKRDLVGLDEELRRRRTEDEASLRDLEAYFNKRVLADELRTQRVETLQGEVENTYRLLTSDDVTTGARTEALDRLERSGVDTDALLSEFVSYQTMRSHLRDCLQIDTSRESTIDRSDAEDTVFSLVSRTESVIDQTLSRLRSAAELRTGELDLAINVRVACEECGREYPVSQLLDRGHCACYADDEPASSPDET